MNNNAFGAVITFTVLAFWLIIAAAYVDAASFANRVTLLGVGMFFAGLAGGTLIGYGFAIYGDDPLLAATSALRHEIVLTDAQLLDYFAAHALQGLLAGRTPATADKAEIAFNAYSFAKHMLERRQEEVA